MRTKGIDLSSCRLDVQGMVLSTDTVSTAVSGGPSTASITNAIGFIRIAEEPG